MTGSAIKVRKLITMARIAKFKNTGKAVSVSLNTVIATLRARTITAKEHATPIARWGEHRMTEKAKSYIPNVARRKALKMWPILETERKGWRRRRIVGATAG